MAGKKTARVRSDVSTRDSKGVNRFLTLGPGSAPSALIRRASGTRGSRSFRLESEQRVPSTEHFFQFVIENFRPRLQEQVRAA